MACPQLDDQVILQRDIPELKLRRGDVGVVRGTVDQPTAAFEVDFVEDTFIAVSDPALPVASVGNGQERSTTTGAPP